MVKTSSRKLTRMGRRNFIKTLSSMGLSAEIVGNLSKDQLSELTSDPRKQVPIPIVHRNVNEERDSNGNRRETIYDTIPHDKWIQTEAAHKAARNIENRTIRKFGANNIHAGVRHDLDELTVEVEYDRSSILGTTQDDKFDKPNIGPQKIQENLPNKVDVKVGKGKLQKEIENIPVRFKEMDDKSTLQRQVKSNNYFDSDYDDIPGGSCIETERRFDDNGDGDFDDPGDQKYAISTTCATGRTPLRGRYPSGHPRYKNVIIAAGHAFTGNGDVHGKKAWQPYRSYKQIGSCRIAKWENARHTRFDASVIYKPYPGYLSTKNRLADKNGGFKTWPVKGIASWSGLKNGYTSELNQQGISSGVIKDNKVVKTYSDSNYAHKAIELNQNGTNGDSGGPMYNTIDVGGGFGYGGGLGKEIYIAGVYYYGGKGTYIGEVENRFNVYVGD